MTALRVLLADDEPPALARLQALFGDMDGVSVVGAALDGREAAGLIAARRPDVAFLDIRMPGQDGLTLARALGAGDGRRTDVIFVTAFDHFAAEAFELDAVDYLLKPVSAERLRNALARARRRRQAPSAPPAAPPPADGGYVDALWVKHRAQKVRVPVSGIRWVEAAGDYVLLHTDARSHMLRATMEAVGRQVDPAQLVRISRSAFVRPDAVAAVARRGESLEVRLADGATLPVGHTYVRAVRRRFGLSGR